uniref:Uncharacterized protein n=1 Tax=Zea mays TaxID=4577 RepID=B6TGZ5_MAIZE|nr:hypothetical protein [Zea mays]
MASMLEYPNFNLTSDLASLLKMLLVSYALMCLGRVVFVQSGCTCMHRISSLVVLVLHQQATTCHDQAQLLLLPPFR